MTLRDLKETRILNMERAAQELIEQAYILCSEANHTIYERRIHSIELLRRARQYARRVRLVA